MANDDAPLSKTGIWITRIILLLVVAAIIAGILYAMEILPT